MSNSKLKAMLNIACAAVSCVLLIHLPVAPCRGSEPYDATPVSYILWQAMLAGFIVLPTWMIETWMRAEARAILEAKNSKHAERKVESIISAL